jgi:hypothetical protein
MTKERAETIMNQVMAGIDGAAMKNPANAEGLVFIVVVAEPAMGVVSWGTNAGTPMALTLMKEIVMAETTVPEETVQ